MPRARGLWVTLLACVCAGCVSTDASTLEALRARAARETPVPPAAPVERPASISAPRPADPALAPKSLEEVSVALAPLRGDPDAPLPSTGAETLTARERARAGDLDGAVRALADHLRRNPGDLQGWREIARMLDAAGRREIAHEAWGRLLAARPLDAEALSSGGVDAAAARQPLAAAERLLRLRQLRRVGEAPQAEPREAIGLSVALGLALREVGHLRAASQALHEAAEASLAWQGPDAAAMRRQAGDLLRLEGECQMAVGDAQAAARAFAGALEQAAAEDRVALPRLTWSLRSAGRPQAAALAVAEAAREPASAGRAGLPQACAHASAWGPTVLGCTQTPEPFDGVRLRAALALGDAPAADALLACGRDRVDLAPALGFVAERRGLSLAIEAAVQACAAHPERARELAAALRCVAAAPSSVRAALGERLAQDPTARLLRAHFELLGGDAMDAWRLASVPVEGPLAEPVRVAAVEAAGALEDLDRVKALSGEPVGTAPLAAALACAHAAVGLRTEAERWAERAIGLDPACADAWVARTRVDLSGAPIGERSKEAQASLSEARLSAERAWEADPAVGVGARVLLELVGSDASRMDEVRQLIRGAPAQAASLRELDRAEALRRAQAGQVEPAIDALRALLLEDPLDAECARALVAASGGCGRLPEVEAWLDDLRIRRPGAPALLEAVITAKARQGRLTEGVQALREASRAEPESWARRMGWARGLSIAGRHPEAWTVVAPEPVASCPRERLERAEFALRDGRSAMAAELLASFMAGSGLSHAQRIGALGVALRLPPDTPGRRSLVASLGRQALIAPEAGSAALAAAMMDGSDHDAQALATRWARAWSSAAACESAQRLLDEGLPARAAILLDAATTHAAAADRAAIARAQLAVLARLGDDEAALRRLREERGRIDGALLLEGRPGSEAEDVTELAGAFLLAERADAASRLYQEALRMDPSLGEPLNNLAWTRLCTVGADERTGELVARALAHRPDDPSTLDTAGWWNYRRGGGLDLAIDQLRRATAIESPSLESLDHLGDALWAAGRGSEAADAWRLVVESASGRASRAAVMQAFDGMQLRRWGVRAWDAASFYDARDGAAIRRAQAKLKALAEGGQPPVEPRPQAQASPAAPQTPPEAPKLQSPAEPPAPTPAQPPRSP